MTNQVTYLSRERLEKLSNPNYIGPVMGGEILEMARALLAVIDSKPLGLTEYCEQATETVSKWPKWKQQGSDVTKFMDQSIKVVTLPNILSNEFHDYGGNFDYEAYQNSIKAALERACINWGEAK